MIFSILQAAADTTALMQTAPVQQEMKLSLIDLATKGGWLMIVLLLLSIIAIYIFGNKWWMIRKAGQIERIGRPLQDIQTAVENTGNVEVARLEKGLPMLATIAGGAPMIGFLGTVTGMIQAFFKMSTAGNNIDITLLSGGIYEAMVTTVGGLFVGIIAYFGYNFLTSQISNLVFKMERTTIEFIDMLHEPSDK